MTPAMRSSRLAALLGVEREEKRAVILMVTLYFVLAISFVFVQTTAFGLFIQEFGSQNLPYAYLSIAVFSSLAAFLYLKLSERLAFNILLFVNLGVLFLMCIIFWMGLRSSRPHWFIFFLPFLFQTLLNLANLVVWPLAGRMFDLRQAKRLFGLVGAGNWLANIISGFVIAPILAIAGTSNLLSFAGIAILAAGLVLWLILRGNLVPAAPQPPVRENKSLSEAKPSVPLLKNRYVRLIFMYVVLWWISFYFIDNIFFDRAGVQFPSASQLAGFIGRQVSVIGIIALITTTFLTGRILSRFGLRTGLFAMPSIVTFLTLSLALIGAIAPSGPLLFWLANIVKIFNVALGFSLSQASGALLYQPLVGELRNRTQTIAEGIVQPLSIGLAGLILLLFNTALHFDAVGLSFVFLVIAALWLWVIYQLARQYPLTLGEALAKRSLGEATTLVFDSEGLALLKKSLKNPRASVVLYALNQLEQLDPQTWQGFFIAAFPDLLAHPVPEVRREALKRVTSLRWMDAIPFVRQRLNEESVQEVKSMMIRTLAVLGDDQSAGEVEAALNSPERIIRYGALVGLLASARTEWVDRAEQYIHRQVESPDAEDRMMAANLMTEMSYRGGAQHLARLLADGSISVKRSALRAVPHQNVRGLWDKAVEACDSPDIVQVAEQVLIAGGANSFPSIRDALQNMKNPGQRLHSLIRVLKFMPDKDAAGLLQLQMNATDSELRLQVLESLSALDFRAKSTNQILGQVRDEIAVSMWIAGALEILDGFGHQQETKLLKAALEVEFRQSRDRVLLLLSFVYHPQGILRARQTLDGGGVRQSGFALETVDALLPANLKPLVMPLIETISFPQRVKRWSEAGLHKIPKSMDALLASLIEESGNQHSPWTRVCAIYSAGILGRMSCKPALEDLLDSSDPRVRDISRWSVNRLLSVPSEGGHVMLSLVEKVLALKSTMLFGETPDNVLADVAGLVEEIYFESGDIVFRKSDLGDSLYIIVSGKVQAWDDGRLLNDLGEGDIFGEMALLDPEPRLATIKVVESAHLLRLDQSHFHEILAERPEISTGIIRVITRYLRSVLREANQVETDLKHQVP